MQLSHNDLSGLYSGISGHVWHGQKSRLNPEMYINENLWIEVLCLGPIAVNDPFLLACYYSLSLELTCECLPVNWAWTDLSHVHQNHLSCSDHLCYRWLNHSLNHLGPFALDLNHRIQTFLKCSQTTTQLSSTSVSSDIFALFFSFCTYFTTSMLPLSGNHTVTHTYYNNVLQNVPQVL